MRKLEEEYEVGDVGLYSESGCLIRVRVASKRVTGDDLELGLEVLERLNPTPDGRYPERSQPGDIFTVGKQIGANLIGILWTLWPDESRAVSERIH